MSVPRLKILHVVFSLEPGGMENGLVNVARGLNREEFEVYVCCLDRGGAFVERLPEPSNVFILGRQQGFSMKTVMGLKQILRQLKPDVIHTHNLGPLIYASLATNFGVSFPILHGEHGVLPPEQCTWKPVLERKLLYRTCTAIHTVSAGQRVQLEALGLPLAKLSVLVNGVDTQRFSPGCRLTARKETCLPEDALLIGIVGRFVALKRHVELFEAFEKLGTEFPQAHLLVVGGGGADQEKIMHRAKSNKFAERIHMVGFQSNPLPYYRAMDLLAVPSIVEGMSNVVLEAMACGVPVLAHNACGNSEMLTHGVDGLVEDLATVENLQQALAATLKNRGQLPLMGEKARENVVSRFSISKMIQNYEDLYRRTAGRIERAK